LGPANYALIEKCQGEGIDVGHVRPSGGWADNDNDRLRANGCHLEGRDGLRCVDRIISCDIEVEHGEKSAARKILLNGCANAGIRCLIPETVGYAQALVKWLAIHILSARCQNTVGGELGVFRTNVCARNGPVFAVESTRDRRWKSNAIAIGARAGSGGEVVGSLKCRFPCRWGHSLYASVMVVRGVDFKEATVAEHRVQRHVRVDVVGSSRGRASSATRAPHNPDFSKLDVRG